MFPIQFISKLDNLESRCLELAFYPLRPCTQSVSHIFTSSAALRTGLVQRWSLPRRDARGHTPSLAAPAHLSTSPALASGPLAASHQGRTCPGGAPCRQGECIYLFEDVDQSQNSDSKHQLRSSKFEVQSLIMKCLGARGCRISDSVLQIQMRPLTFSLFDEKQSILALHHLGVKVRPELLLPLLHIQALRTRGLRFRRRLFHLVVIFHLSLRS